MSAGETFGIDVEIKTDKTEQGLAKVDKALENTEKTAKDAGRAATIAFAEAAEATLRAAKEAREWDAALAQAKARERAREVDGLASAFRSLEEKTLSAVRAERDYLEAEKTVSAALKAGIATEEQAVAILNEKAKALEQVTVLQQQEADSAKAAGDAAGSAGGSFMKMVEGIGNVGSAMNTFHMALSIGAHALDYYATVADIASKAVHAFKPTPTRADEISQSTANDQITRLAAVGYRPEDLPVIADRAFGDVGTPFHDRSVQQAMMDHYEEVEKFLEKMEAYAAKGKKDADNVAKQLADARAAQAKAAEEMAKEEEEWNKRDEQWKALATEGGGVEEWNPKTKTWKTITKPSGGGKEVIYQQASAWDQLGSNISLANDYLQEYIDSLNEEDALQKKIQGQIDFGTGLAGGILGKIGGALGGAGGALSDAANDQVFEKKITEAQKFADALQGPVKGAIDGLVDGLVKWNMSWKDWGRTALEEIERVLLKLLALQGIEAIFGAYGGSGTAGQFLWGIFGGGAKPAPTAAGRIAIGDPFGGAAQTSGAVWRDPVQRQAPQGGGGSMPGPAPVYIVNVGDQRAAALAVMQAPEGARIILNHVAANSGALSAIGKR